MWWVKDKLPLVPAAKRAGSLELNMRSTAPWQVMNDQVFPHLMPGYLDGAGHKLGYHFNWNPLENSSGTEEPPLSDHQQIKYKVLSPLTVLKIPFNTYALGAAARVSIKNTDHSSGHVILEESRQASSQGLSCTKTSA